MPLVGTQDSGSWMPFWVQMGSNVVPKSVKWVHLGSQKGVIIAANDDDTFLDPAGSPYGSVGSPFGSHVGSNVVQISPKWVCLAPNYVSSAL